MPPGKKYKILFITSEVVPFIKTGGLADVSSALPQKLQEMGHQVRIVVPKYGAIDERKYKIHEVVRLKDLKTKINDKEVIFSLRSSFLVGQKARVQIYFLDNQEYFGSRHSLYNDPITGEEFQDNDERFILLAKSVYELIERLGWIPDIIHCNDWQCGLVPVYLKILARKYPELKEIKCLYTVHNLAYQGEFPKSSFAKTGLPEELNSNDYLLHKNKLNFLKSGLVFADAINTVSETYASELTKYEDYGEGLFEVLKKRKKDIHGIINGIDDSIWNPSKDKKIEKKYSSKSLELKEDNKRALVEKFGFKYDPKVPIISMISRIDANKGFDLIKKSFNEILKLNVKFILLGNGDKKLHRFFEEMAAKKSSKFACYLGFDEELAHLIEAGSDIYLMPSKIEPCGLNQMYSLVYGTVPIVRATGGLADTVEPFEEKSGNGNGFVFTKYDKEELLKSVKNAVKIFSTDEKSWQKIMRNGMKANFSWLTSAKNYVELYKKLLTNK